MLRSLSLPWAIDVLLFVSCMLSFSWGIRSFFAVSGKVERGMRMISALGAALGAVHLIALVFFSRPGEARFWIASALYALSLALFWMSVSENRRRPLSLAYSLDSPAHLVTTGPYRWVRHPFYTSYLLAWTAGCVASGQMLLVVTVLVMMVLYWRAAALEEHKFDDSPLAHEYAAYRNATGRFLPRLF